MPHLCRNKTRIIVNNYNDDRFLIEKLIMATQSNELLAKMDWESVAYGLKAGELTITYTTEWRPALAELEQICQTNNLTMISYWMINESAGSWRSTQGICEIIDIKNGFENLDLSEGLKNFLTIETLY